MRREEHEHGERPVVVVRAVFATVFLALWWMMTMRNEGLRATEHEMALRAQYAREIRSLRVALLEAQPSLPEPGRGDPAWWKDRFAKESKKLTVLRNEVRPGELPMGTFAIQRHDLSVKGEYEAVMRLVAWMETATPRVRIDQFVLEPVPPADVRADFVLLLPVPKGRR